MRDDARLMRRIVEALEDDEDLERTVACVNALAGIDDPAAFRRAVDELVRIGDHALDEWWRFEEGDEQERESIRQARLHLANALAAICEQLPDPRPEERDDG